MKRHLFSTLLFLVVCLSAFGQMSDDANLIAKEHGGFVVAVQGSSMEPMFHENDLLIVNPMDVSKLKVGMVCVYENNLGELVAHSVVSLHPLRLKGLSNKVIDSDEVVTVKGVMYGIVHNIFNEKVTEKLKVMAKKVLTFHHEWSYLYTVL